MPHRTGVKSSSDNLSWSSLLAADDNEEAVALAGVGAVPCVDQERFNPMSTEIRGRLPAGSVARAIFEPAAQRHMRQRLLAGIHHPPLDPPSARHTGRHLGGEVQP